MAEELNFHEMSSCGFVGDIGLCDIFHADKRSVLLQKQFITICSKKTFVKIVHFVVSLQSAKKQCFACMYRWCCCQRTWLQCGTALNTTQASPSSVRLATLSLSMNESNASLDSHARPTTRRRLTRPFVPSNSHTDVTDSTPSCSTGISIYTHNTSS